MPIPKFDGQKQLSLPRTAQGQSLDLRQFSQPSIEMAQQSIKNIAQAGSDLSKFLVAEGQMEAATKGNAAFNKLNDDLSELNAERALWKDADAVANQPKYDERENQIFTDFYKNIDGIEYGHIREEVRQRANQVRIGNKADSITFFETQKKNFQNQQYDTAILNYTDDAKKNYQNGLNNLPQLQKDFAYLDGQIANKMANLGYSKITGKDLTDEQKEHNRLVDEIVTREAKKQRTVLLNNVTEDMLINNYDMTPWKEAASSIKLVEQAENLGLITKEDSLKRIKELEIGQMRVEYKRNKNQFYDQSTGRFLSENRKYNAPHLTPEEYEQAAATIAGEKGSKKGTSDTVNYASVQSAFDILAQNGQAVHAKDLFDLLSSKEEYYDEIVNDSDKAKTNDIDRQLKMWQFLNLLDNGAVVLDSSGNYRQMNENKETDAEIISSGSSVVRLSNNDAIKKARNNIALEIQKNVRSNAYNNGLQTKLWHNIDPNINQVGEVVVSKFLHDQSTEGFWRGVGRFLGFVVEPKKDLIRPFGTARVLMSAVNNMQKELATYGIKSEDEIYDKNLGKSFTKTVIDPNTNEKTVITATYESIVDSSLAKGIIDELGAEQVISIFGSVEKAQETVTQLMKDFRQQIINYKNAKNYAGYYGVGSTPSMVLNYRYSPSSRAQVDAAQANNLNDISKTAQLGTIKMAADELQNPKLEEDISKISDKLPYDLNYALDDFNNRVQENMWSKVQSMNPPSYTQFLNTTPADGSVYNGFIGNIIEDLDASELMQNDNVFADVTKNIEIIKADNNTSAALDSLMNDYVGQQGVFSQDIRQKMSPSLISSNGELSQELIDSGSNMSLSLQGDNPTWKKLSEKRSSSKKESFISASEPVKMSAAPLPVISAKQTPKLYFAGPKKQYYFDSNGTPYRFTLPSNELFATLCLMKGRKASPLTNNAVIDLPDETQYVHGGGWRNVLSPNSPIDIDFTYF